MVLSSMTTLAAFSLLFTYTCLALFPLPRVHIWGSNTFSSSFPRSIYLRTRVVNKTDECWHSTTISTTTLRRSHFPRKSVRTKAFPPVFSIMPTSSDVNVPSTLVTEETIEFISSEVEADAYVDKIQARNFPIFSPPGARPIRVMGSRNTPVTKTKLKVEKKAMQAKKVLADEEKKRTIAARKIELLTKRREKAIAAAEARVQKASAKATALRNQLESVKATGATVRTNPITKVGVHVPKKSKGVTGNVALMNVVHSTSTTTSPQRKVASPKKRVMLHSPLRLVKDAASSTAADAAAASITNGNNHSSHSLSSWESDTSLSLRSVSSVRGNKATFRGGRRQGEVG